MRNNTALKCDRPPYWKSFWLYLSVGLSEIVWRYNDVLQQNNTQDFDKDCFSGSMNVCCRSCRSRSAGTAYTLPFSLKEWMNARMNAWMNERMNEWMNERVSEWVNEWMNERTTERTKERTKEGMNEWMNEWTNERRNEWMNEQTN